MASSTTSTPDELKRRDLPGTSSVVSMGIPTFGVVIRGKSRTLAVAMSAAINCDRNGSEASIGVWLLMNVASLTASALQALIW